MEQGAGRPLLVNQLALEQQMQPQQIEAFRDEQRRREVQLVSDLNQGGESAGAPEERTTSGIQKEGEEEDRKLKEVAEGLVSEVKQADSSEEEFWEGRISLLFGRDFQGRPLSGKIEWELDSAEEKEEARKEPAREKEGASKF
jgi:hypothetical protein